MKEAMFFFRKKLTYFGGVATLVGTVIGAGILGIPYAVDKAGLLPGMALLAALTLTVLLRHLMIGEVALRTHGDHQIVGYYGIYLGKPIKYIMTVEFVVGLYGSLLAYLIGSGRVLAAMLGGDSYWYSILFFAVTSVMLFRGLTMVKHSEMILTVLLTVVVLGIALTARNHFYFPDLSAMDAGNMVLPYGVMMFALAGVTAIPEIKREIHGIDRRRFRSILIAGSVIPAVIYAVFTIVTLGVTGNATTEIATVGLGEQLGPTMVLLGNLFALFAMSTSTLTVGLALRDMYRFDYGIRTPLAWAAAIIPPLILFFLGQRSFVHVINWLGGVMGGIASIASIILFWRARTRGNRTPEYQMGKLRIAGALMIVMYCVGIWVTLR